MKINTKIRDSVLIISLKGELTLNNREKVQHELEAFLDGNQNVVINGSELTYVDSSGLGLFLEITNKLKKNKLKSLVFADIATIVRKSLEVTHLIQVMPVYNTEEEAVSSFSNKWRWQIFSRLVYVKAVSNKILEAVSSIGLEDYFLVEVRLCIEEAVINAIKHGYHLNSQGIVTIEFELQDKRLEIAVIDEGEGFDTKVKGKGLSLIFSFMDEVKFNEKGNKIIMVKNL